MGGKEGVQDGRSAVIEYKEIPHCYKRLKHNPSYPVLFFIFHIFRCRIKQAPLQHTTQCAQVTRPPHLYGTQQLLLLLRTGCASLPLHRFLLTLPRCYLHEYGL